MKNLRTAKSFNFGDGFFEAVRDPGFSRLREDSLMSPAGPEPRCRGGDILEVLAIVVIPAKLVPRKRKRKSTSFHTDFSSERGYVNACGQVPGVAVG